MNRDDVIRMFHEAGESAGWKPGIGNALVINYLTHFAALVAAAEREACAKVCDEKVNAEYATGKVDHNEMGWTQACAIAIRARGQA